MKWRKRRFEKVREYTRVSVNLAINKKKRKKGKIIV